MKFCFCFTGNVNARDPDYWNVPDDPGIRHTDWMKKLPDSMSVSKVSIPGTHDTMARAGDIIWSWCQSLSLSIQLKIGIRFFDIRCRHFKNGLPIHHGQFYEHCSFTDVMNTMTSFVKSHPSEVLLVRVKEEYKAAECTRTFCETVWLTLQNYRENIWLEENIPFIKEVRGKIIILRDFKRENNPIGIPYATLDIEDYWKASSYKEKWRRVKAHLDKTRSTTDNIIHLTFNSCTKGIDAPREIARSLNPKLYKYVRANQGHGRFGIIAIDYPGPKLVEYIIENNFKTNVNVYQKNNSVFSCVLL